MWWMTIKAAPNSPPTCEATRINSLMTVALFSSPCSTEFNVSITTNWRLGICLSRLKNSSHLREGLASWVFGSFSTKANAPPLLIDGKIIRLSPAALRRLPSGSISDRRICNSSLSSSVVRITTAPLFITGIPHHVSPSSRDDTFNARSKIIKVLPAPPSATSNWCLAAWTKLATRNWRSGLCDIDQRCAAHTASPCPSATIGFSGSTIGPWVAKSFLSNPCHSVPNLASPQGGDIWACIQP